MYLTRRQLLAAASALAVPSALAGLGSRGQAFGAPSSAFVMPREGAPHEATWMAYGATAEAWGAGGSHGASRHVARHDLMRIAANLSRFETVKVIVANKKDAAEARALLAKVRKGSARKDQVNDRHSASATGSDGRILASKKLPPIAPDRIHLLVQPVNDLWTRDTAPVFVRDKEGRVAAVDLNFNGWGQERISTGLPGWRVDPEKRRNGIERQPVAHDRKIARFVSDHLGVPRVATWLTMEGGGIEVNGRGLALVSESCVLNTNRNPGKSKAQVEAEFARVFGVQHVLWVPGVRATDITDGHIDFYARFASNREIPYTWDGGLDEGDDASVDALNLEMLEAGAARIHALPKADRERLLGRSDARIRLTALDSPDPERVRASVVKRTPALAARGSFQDESFAAGYVGYYEANGCVLMGQFGDPESDAAAFETIRVRYPERTIVQMTTDGLANGGGTIHCATQQQIKA